MNNNIIYKFNTLTKDNKRQKKKLQGLSIFFSFESY